MDKLDSSACIFLKNSNLMARRAFIFAPLILFLSRKSEAFIPLIFGFAIRAVATTATRSSVVRYVARNGARAAVRTGARATTRRDIRGGSKNSFRKNKSTKSHDINFIDNGMKIEKIISRVEKISDLLDIIPKSQENEPIVKIIENYQEAIKTSPYSSKNPYSKNSHTNISTKSSISNLAQIDKISPALAKLAIKSAAEAIWVQKGVENEAEIILENNTSEYLALNEIYINIRDIKTGQVESKTSIGLIQAKPYAKFSFVVLISNIPKKGIKRLEVESQVKSIPSRNIIVI